MGGREDGGNEAVTMYGSPALETSIEHVSWHRARVAIGFSARKVALKPYPCLGSTELLVPNPHELVPGPKVSFNFLVYKASALTLCVCVYLPSWCLRDMIVLRFRIRAS